MILLAAVTLTDLVGYLVIFSMIVLMALRLIAILSLQQERRAGEWPMDSEICVKFITVASDGVIGHIDAKSPVQALESLANLMSANPTAMRDVALFYNGAMVGSVVLRNGEPRVMLMP